MVCSSRAVVKHAYQQARLASSYRHGSLLKPRWQRARDSLDWLLPDRSAGQGCQPLASTSVGRQAGRQAGKLAYSFPQKPARPRFYPSRGNLARAPSSPSVTRKLAREAQQEHTARAASGKPRPPPTRADVLMQPQLDGYGKEHRLVRR